MIGVESERARDVMSAVYRPLNLIQTPMVFTNIETAELTKYAGNAFLATKITFINEIADLCEKVGADVHDVARGIGLDGRIGRKFLHPGPGLRRLLLSEGHAGAGLYGARGQRTADDRRAGDRGEQRPQEEDGAEGHRFLRRFGRGPDDRRAGPDVQAQHRRHARRAVARHRAGAAGGRGPDRGLRSRRHGRGGTPAEGCDLRKDRVRGGDGRRRPGRHHRMARVPRARPAAHQGA